MIEYLIALAIALRLYNAFAFFLIKRRIRGPAKITEGFEPIKYKRGKKVALIIHGFTSTPKETCRLANFLQKKNISVSVPLLPGHGTSPERLAITKRTEWLDHIKKEIKRLEKEYSEIYLIGNSFGGNIALILTETSKKIKGVITLGTPILLPHEGIVRYVLLPILKRVKIFQKKKYNARRAELLMQKRSNSYLIMPIRSIAQFAKVLDLSKEALPTIKKPILVAQSLEDTVIRAESAQYIIDHVTSKEKTYLAIKKSYHNLLVDNVNPRLNQKIIEFIRKKRS